MSLYKDGVNIVYGLNINSMSTFTADLQDGNQLELMVTEDPATRRKFKNLGSKM